jgi:hypothetical protein
MRLYFKFGSSIIGHKNLETGTYGDHEKPPKSPTRSLQSDLSGVGQRR